MGLAKRNPIDRFHEAALAADTDALDFLLHDDAVFESPLLHTPQEGKALAKRYIGAAFETLANTGFHYVGVWHAPRSAVLEFKCRLDDVEVNGVDIIQLDEAGRITRFKVMIRPLKAIQALGARMAERLGRVDRVV